MKAPVHRDRRKAVPVNGPAEAPARAADSASPVAPPACALCAEGRHATRHRAQSGGPLPAAVTVLGSWRFRPRRL